MFKKTSALFAAAFLLFGAFFPFHSLLAGEYQTESGVNVNYDGLVPCGKCVNISSSVKADKLTAEQCGVSEGAFVPVKYTPCQLCHFFVMFDETIDFFLNSIVFPVGALMLVIGGLMFITAVEDPGRIEKAKKLITSTFLGLIIIFSAWTVINLFFVVIGISDFAPQADPNKWFVINCPISL